MNKKIPHKICERFGIDVPISPDEAKMLDNPYPQRRSSREQVEKNEKRVWERRQKLMGIMKRHPNASYGAIAKILNTTRHIIADDVRKITANFKEEARDMFLAHRMRVLTELTDAKRLAMKRLDTLKNEPTKGTRWLEEWGKLVDKECKILGLYAPKHAYIDIHTTRVDENAEGITDQQRDAAIDGVMAAILTAATDPKSKIAQLAPFAATKKDEEELIDAEYDIKE